MEKKYCFVVFFLIIIFVMSLIGMTAKLYEINNLTAYEYLEQNSVEKTPVELLYMENFDSEDSFIVFYSAADGSVACSILEKKLFSYEIINHSGYLSKSFDDSYVWFSDKRTYGSDDANGIAWGLIQNPEVSAVYIGDKKCNHAEVEGYDFRLFWVVINESEMKNDPTIEFVETDSKK